MKTKLDDSSQNTVDKPTGSPDGSTTDVLKFKKRMLKWPNPVEFVNNMYGCHPGDDDGDDNEYFKKVFSE